MENMEETNENETLEEMADEESSDKDLSSFIRSSRTKEPISKSKKIKPKNKEKKKGGNLKLALVLSMVVFIAVLIGLTSYFYIKYKNAIKNPNTVTESEVKAISGKIERFMDLPDEEPTLATVTDKEKIKDNPFFAKAENGDKVLFYANAKETILYRPSTERVINVTSFQGSSSSQSSSDKNQDSDQGNSKSSSNSSQSSSKSSASSSSSSSSSSSKKAVK